MLTGIKILDMTRVLAGPLSTMMLADLGAEVIKVERPGVGDETRGWGPPFSPAGESAYYLSINRNKLGIEAGLDDPADMQMLSSLMASADVVVENFKPGALARRGLDHGTVLARHPALVWCTIGGFDAGSERPGYDFVVQAESGWMSVTGDPMGEPMKHGIALADVIAGKDAAIAILAALVVRGATGLGRHVRVSLIESARAALVNVAQNALVSGAAPSRWGNAHANLVPYQLFQASDRHVVIAVGTDGQWVGCLRALDLERELGGEALATNRSRLASRARIVSVLSARVAQRSAAEWISRLNDEGVPCGVVRSVAEVLAEVDASAVTGMPPSVPGSVRRAPPRLGEHTALVREVGWKAFGALQRP